MEKRKKNILMMSGALAISGLLFFSAFSSLSSGTPEQQEQEVSLRADVSDVSLSDMLTSVENNKNASNLNSSSELAFNNASSLSVKQVDDPEAVARIQALIRANEENLSSGLQDIEAERNGIISSPSKKNDTSVHEHRQPSLKNDTNREDIEELDSIEADVLVQPVKASPFHTIALTNTTNKNAIKAYVHSEQVVMVGSTLKMRLGEATYTDNGVAIPKNSPVFGVVTGIDGERVNVRITHINVNGNILPFEKQVYSKDALLGIYVPGNSKADATKDVTGDVLDAIPTSGITAVDAAARIAGGVASSAANAGKQTLSKNVRKIKITIKTNYEIYFRPDEKCR